MNKEENAYIKPRIGIRVSHNGKKGVILQSGKDLPLYLRTGKEGDGPFYGVSYYESEYVWYNYKNISNIINQ